MQNSSLEDGLGRAAVELHSKLRRCDPETWAELRVAFDALHAEAISSGVEELANRAWFLRKVVVVRTNYISAIQDFREERYYEGWCKLEQVEIDLDTLQKNPFYNCDMYDVEYLAEQVRQWQSLFPYKVFLSPEMIIRRRECSICGQSVDPWSSCRHEVFKVYNGKECYRIIKDCELLGVSLVLDPVQKYSVARVFTEDSDGKKTDQFNYSPIKFVTDRISSAFSRWSVERTHRRQPHNLFMVKEGDPCPCESGRLSRDCCLREDGVLRPHLQFDFDEPPPAHLSSYEFIH
jgi:hypothetical protein